MKYPFLKKNIVIVSGHSAWGIYDLNKGVFHRVNIEAGHLMQSIRGLKKMDDFSGSEQKFISRAISAGLIALQEKPLDQETTKLQDVLRPTRPVRFAWIEITSKCNQKCEHCFLGSDLNRFAHVSTQTILNHLDTLSEIGARQVVISGGEPTVHPDIIPILRHTRDQKFRASLLSNASSPKFSVIISELVDSEIVVKVPFLGWGDSHDQMTGLSGSFERTRKNVIKLVEAGVRVELGSTVTAINHRCIPLIRDFANSLRIPLEVSPIYSVGYAKNNAKLFESIRQEDIIKVCREDKASSRPVPRTYPRNLKHKYDPDPIDYDAVNLRDYLTEHHECGQKIIAILSSGHVTPCLMLRDEKYSLGRIGEYSLRDILGHKSDHAGRFSELMHLKNIPGCSGCEARFICKAGACMASSVAHLGTIHARNPMYQRCYYLNDVGRREVGLEPIEIQQVQHAK